MKFTFKLHPRETGLAGVGNPYQGSDIKLNKQIVGTIYPATWREAHWKVSIRRLVPASPNHPSTWRNMIVSQFNTEGEAKEWIKSKLADYLKDHQIELSPETND